MFMGNWKPVSSHYFSQHKKAARECTEPDVRHPCSICHREAIGNHGNAAGGSIFAPRLVADDGGESGAGPGAPAFLRAARASRQGGCGCGSSTDNGQIHQRRRRVRTLVLSHGFSLHAFSQISRTLGSSHIGERRAFPRRSHSCER